jgi:HPt (histidine-containing phosphotransfer) domain-containing protein
MTANPNPPQTASGAPPVADFRPEMLAPLVSMYEAEGARELAETMRDDLPRQRADFALALVKKDRVSCARVAHSLKSEVRMVAADALGHALERAERDLREANFDEGVAAMPELLDRCGALFGKLCEAANA